MHQGQQKVSNKTSPVASHRRRLCIGPRPADGQPHLVSLGPTSTSVPSHRFPLPVESRGQRPRACVGPSGYCRLLPSSLSTNALLVLPTLQPCFRLYSFNLSYMYEVSSELFVLNIGPRQSVCPPGYSLVPPPTVSTRLKQILGLQSCLDSLPYPDPHITVVGGLFGRLKTSFVVRWDN